MAVCAISSRTIAFDTDRRELQRGADIVSVAPQVFDVLDYLIRNRERVVSKDELIKAIWNGRIVSEVALTTRLNAVRSAIGDSGSEQRLIKTLAAQGLSFRRTGAGSADGRIRRIRKRQDRTARTRACAAR